MILTIKPSEAQVGDRVLEPLPIPSTVKEIETWSVLRRGIGTGVTGVCLTFEDNGVFNTDDNNMITVERHE